MNSEFQAVLEYMERERGIDRETVLTAVESALVSASKRGPGSAARELRIDIDRKTYDIRAFAQLEVVERAVDSNAQISLAQARKTHPEAQLGDVLEIEVTTKDFGRIAAQTAKQAILQRSARRRKSASTRSTRTGPATSSPARCAVSTAATSSSTWAGPRRSCPPRSGCRPRNTRWATGCGPTCCGSTAPRTART